MKPIQLSKKNWKKLSKWRVELDCKTYDDVVTKLIKLVSYYKLGNELKEVNSPNAKGSSKLNTDFAEDVNSRAAHSSQGGAK